MKQNFLTEFKDEKEFFISKFEAIGWRKIDHVLCKKMEFMVDPSSKNEDGKYTLPIYFYPDFLSYSGEAGECLEMWVRCMVSIESTENNDTTMIMLAKQLIGEIKKTGWQAFQDEDAYLNFFTRPESKNGRTSISFYLNKDYPKGFWENHTL